LLLYQLSYLGTPGRDARPERAGRRHVYPQRKRPSSQRAAVRARGALPFELRDLLFDEVDDLGFELHAVERVDLLNSGRARDVHLGESAADDVEAGEKDA